MENTFHKIVQIARVKFKNEKDFNKKRILMQKEVFKLLTQHEEMIQEGIIKEEFA